MKITNILSAILIPAAICIIGGCSSELQENQSSVKEEAKAKYLRFSATPTVSFFEIRNNHFSRSYTKDYAVGITQEDIDYLNSLSQDELIDLRNELMIEAGFESEEQLEAYIDELYNRVMDMLTPEEQIKLHNFVEEYIEMPRGLESL